MSATIIDGKRVAAQLKERVAAGVVQLREKYGKRPGLTVIRVGEDPASEVYVRKKRQAAEAVGIQAEEHYLSTATTAEELAGLVDQLNADDQVDGILLQLPLPEHLDETPFLERILPGKDVDGFHPKNIGRLVTGSSPALPCTPGGIMELLDSADVPLSGRRAVVIGRSNIVGKPMAFLLLAANATVTICHSRTRELPDLCRTADVLVAAVGRPEMVRGDWVKPGAAVIDVGMNRLEDGRLVGDVAYDEVRERAAFLTPVPGGVGPMTVAMLMRNTWKAAERRVTATGSS